MGKRVLKHFESQVVLIVTTLKSFPCCRSPSSVCHFRFVFLLSVDWVLELYPLVVAIPLYFRL